MFLNLTCSGIMIQKHVGLERRDIRKGKGRRLWKVGRRTSGGARKGSQRRSGKIRWESRDRFSEHGASTMISKEAAC